MKQYVGGTIIAEHDLKEEASIILKAVHFPVKPQCRL
jgi:hypothetical protein